jgi:hypothetical protein
MKCPRCSAENPDDKSFCGECGTELTESVGVDDDTQKYFVEYQWLGRTQSYTKEGWSIRVVFSLLIAGLFALLAGATGHILGAFVFFVFIVIMVLVGYALAKRYQKVGRPLGVFGEVPRDEKTLADPEEWKKL